jgi:hypothetical protein
LLAVEVSKHALFSSRRKFAGVEEKVIAQVDINKDSISIITRVSISIIKRLDVGDAEKLATLDMNLHRVEFIVQVSHVSVQVERQSIRREPV